MDRPKIAKLLAPSAPLVLEVDKGAHKLELKLAWTMRAVILIESRLRAEGVALNALQNPSQFWVELDCTKLAIGVWATAQQDQPEYGDETGFDLILSFLTVENYGVAAAALKEAFLQSLSEERREEIKAAEQRLAAGVTPPTVPADPTLAPGLR